MRPKSIGLGLTAAYSIPSLAFVTIKDDTFEYSSKDVVQWLPVPVPKLQHLLEELEAAYGLEGNGRGEDEEEDTKSFLALPDAIMLQGCQSLEKLHPHIRTVEENHTKMITEADMIVTGIEGTPDRIVAPKLPKLYINGYWMLDNQDVMTQFHVYMLLNLRVDTHGWGSGISVDDFVVLHRSCGASIKILRMDLAGPLLTKEEEIELRMCRSSVWRQTKASVKTVKRIYSLALDENKGYRFVLAIFNIHRKED
ncbi:MAG: hypothetical protein J3R72DRAFT_496704 [Linnemannia gamsii]|nr:MAG: hypothetical protein J3R72DRAFT_496704 [Linnemannia gamsii]